VRSILERFSDLSALTLATAGKNLIKADTRSNLLGNRIVLVAPADSDVKLDVAAGMDLAGALASSRHPAAAERAAPARRAGAPGQHRAHAADVARVTCSARPSARHCCSPWPRWSASRATSCALLRPVGRGRPAAWRHHRPPAAHRACCLTQGGEAANARFNRRRRSGNILASQLGARQRPRPQAMFAMLMNGGTKSCSSLSPAWSRRRTWRRWTPPRCRPSGVTGFPLVVRPTGTTAVGPQRLRSGPAPAARSGIKRVVAASAGEFTRSCAMAEQRVMFTCRARHCALLRKPRLPLASTPVPFLVS
jgi:hypothetical protein